MSSHYKFYPAGENVVVPFNARYSFPTQANKTVKITPRIPPKSGQNFEPGQTIRVEFPAQGFVNPGNTCLEFDVTLYGYSLSDDGVQVRFQNGIRSLFQRVRLMYGSTPLEDIIDYNQICRMLTEWTGTSQNATLDNSSIHEGIGGLAYGLPANWFPPPTYGDVLLTTAPVVGKDLSVHRPGRGNNMPLNARTCYIQGLDYTGAVTSISDTPTGGPIPTVMSRVPDYDTFVPATNVGFNSVPNSVDLGSLVATGARQHACTRRYQVTFDLGLFLQEKLIPVKYMASQLAIEITLESPTKCILVTPSGVATNAQLGTIPTYSVGNVNLIPEIVEFDASYGTQG